MHNLKIKFIQYLISYIDKIIKKMENQNKYTIKNVFETIVYIILCHCLGDYFFQTEYLAINKAKDNYCLFLHCVTYCTPFILKFGLSWKIYFIFFIHIITDASKAKYDLISLTTDQIIHYVVALVFIEKNWENNGHINLNIGKEMKNDVIE